MGEVRIGKSQYIENPKDLRSHMSTYYDFFSPSGIRNDPIFITPYIDGWGLGTVTSLCLPMFNRSILFGVTCVDVTLTDLFSDVTYFEDRHLSYAFLIDGSGFALSHPLLQRPINTNRPLRVDIKYLERSDAAGTDSIIESMKRGESGSKSIRSKQVASLGDPYRNGVRKTEPRLLHYHWQKVSKTNLSICVVLVNRDTHAVLDSRSLRDNNPYAANSLLYHKLDLNVRLGKPQVDKQHLCTNFGRYATKDRCTFMISPKGFMNPYRYLMTQESTQSVYSFKLYLKDGHPNSTPAMKEGINNTLLATEGICNLWTKLWTTWSNDSVVWRYVGTKDGITRIFPGTEIPKTFDPTVRPWFTSALAMPTQLVLSSAYIDRWGAGPVVTLSKAINQTGISSNFLGVVALDYPLNTFFFMMEDIFPEYCGTKDHSCFIMDSSGYLVVHKDFVYSKSCTTRIENIHIIEKEPTIAADLIKLKVLKQGGCLNLVNKSYQYFWTVDLPDPRGLDRLQHKQYKIVPIPGVNAYFVLKDSVHFVHGIITCTSCQNSNTPFSNECRAEGSSCRCPCFKMAEFQYCKNVYPKLLPTDPSDGHELPTCTPNLPIDSFYLESQMSKIKSLPDCMPKHCESMQIERECVLLSGCRWCYLSFEGERLKYPFCTSKRTECPFGKLCSKQDAVKPIKTGQQPGELPVPLAVLAGSIVGGVLGLAIIVSVTVVLVRRRPRTSSNSQSLVPGSVKTDLTGMIITTTPEPPEPPRVQYLPHRTSVESGLDYQNRTLPDRPAAETQSALSDATGYAGLSSGSVPSMSGSLPGNTSVELAAARLMVDSLLDKVVNLKVQQQQLAAGQPGQVVQTVSGEQLTQRAAPPGWDNQTGDHYSNPQPAGVINQAFQNSRPIVWENPESSVHSMTR